jgi:hypothetical protein
MGHGWVVAARQHVSPCAVQLSVWKCDWLGKIVCYNELQIFENKEITKIFDRKKLREVHINCVIHSFLV